MSCSALLQDAGNVVSQFIITRHDDGLDMCVTSSTPQDQINMLSRALHKHIRPSNSPGAAPLPAPAAAAAGGGGGGGGGPSSSGQNESRQPDHMATAGGGGGGGYYGPLLPVPIAAQVPHVVGGTPPAPRAGFESPWHRAAAARGAVGGPAEGAAAGAGPAPPAGAARGATGAGPAPPAGAAGAAAGPPPPPAAAAGAGGSAGTGALTSSTDGKLYKGKLWTTVGEEEELEAASSAHMISPPDSVKVHTPFGTILDITATANTPVWCIKQRIEASTRVPPREQRLYCCWRELPDQVTLKAANVRLGFMLRVLFVGDEVPQPRPGCNIILKNMSGKQMVFPFDGGMYVIELKQLIEREVEGAPVDMLQLVHCGKMLQDIRTLGEQNVAKDHVIHWFFNMRG